ncbi:pantoate--beta-alanine ligase [Rubripirellula amarantea]|nr:pantoate--beta-alanine ligase [Rubripirellula amarantea]
MQLFKTCATMHEAVVKARARGRRVGVVPTMGALHEGHLSLVRASVERCDETVVTIFVNPTQFGPGEDLAKYPRTFDEDIARVEAAGATMVFAPSNEEMYPSGASTFVEPPSVAIPLEGKFRPGHLRGVATIVLKLFHAVPADVAVFGRKDYQQFKVIEAMVRDLNVAIELVAGETVRESDGLAMSSRNRYLSSDDRVRALSLSRALSIAHEAYRQGERSTAALEALMSEELRGVDSVDYASVVDADTLQRYDIVPPKAVALIAARVGGARLIDNRTLS